jgi:VanZ family protein
VSRVSPFISRRVAWILFGTWVFVILAATLTPQGGRTPDELLERCIRCAANWLEDDISNVVLFLPFGAFAALGGWRRGSIIVRAGLLSLAIETSQYLFVGGRDSSMSDVVTNTIGATLGAFLAHPAFGAIVAQGPAARRWLRWAGAAVVAFTVVVSSLMLPSRATTPVWALVERDHAQVVVTRASVNGQPVRIGKVSGDSSFREILRRNDLTVSVDVSHLGKPSRRWDVFSLVDPAASPDPVDIRSTRRGWFGALAWRSQDVGLVGASILLPRSGAVEPPLTVTLERHGSLVSLTESSALGRRRSVTSLNASMVWIPFFPASIALTGSFQPIGVVWVFGVVALLGWFAGRSREWSAGIEVVIMVGASWGIPMALFGLAAPPPWAWGTALVAGAVGAVLGRRFFGAADSSGGGRT